MQCWALLGSAGLEGDLRKIQFSIKMNVGSKAAIVTIIFGQYHFLYVL